MKRWCATCRRERDLRAFDLYAEATTPCRECFRSDAVVREREERAAKRTAAHAKISALKHERRSCIAALVRLDAQAIAADVGALKRAALQEERLSYLAALRKVDAQIAVLEAERRPSSPDLRVQVD